MSVTTHIAAEEVTLETYRRIEFLASQLQQPVHCRDGREQLAVFLRAE